MNYPFGREDTIQPGSRDAELAEQLSRRFGTSIPHDIKQWLWSLPVLLAMEKKLQALEARIEAMDGRGE